MERSTLYRRTDRAIIDAMIRLLKEKPFEEVIIQDILDETPVTRATFYAHFHDKYEVAERMQAMYMDMLHTIPLEMRDVDRKRHPEIIRKAVLRYGDMVNALMHIRTNRVDIRAATSELHRQYYLSQETGDTALVEAEIYAQAMTALQLSYLGGNAAAVMDEDYYDRVMVQVFLKILKMEKDEALRGEILKHLPGGSDFLERKNK